MTMGPSILPVITARPSLRAIAITIIIAADIIPEDTTAEAIIDAAFRGSDHARQNKGRNTREVQRGCGVKGK